MTRNEARARKNLPPVPGGDLLVTPLNVLIGGQSSPTDSAPALGTGAAARRSGTKALVPLSTQTAGWHAKHLERLAEFFALQGGAVAQVLADVSLALAWDDDHWNANLQGVFFALAATMAAEIGAATAEVFSAEYDEAAALMYLETNARIAAEYVNATTREALAAALAASPDAPPAEVAAPVFAEASGARSEQIATTRTVSVANFARHEAARQAGVPYKVWRVNDENPRSPHPTDGEQVPLNEKFSNGAQWPGDPAAGVDQVAGCTCSIEFATEES
jgi:hypothetical protein